jgi:hypothetical protein
MNEPDTTTILVAGNNYASVDSFEVTMRSRAAAFDKHFVGGRSNRRRFGIFSEREQNGTAIIGTVEDFDVIVALFNLQLRNGQPNCVVRLNGDPPEAITRAVLTIPKRRR